MLFHPTFIIIFFTSLLWFITRRNVGIFSKIIALAFPIIAWWFLMNTSTGEYYYKLYNLTLLCKYDYIGRLIGSAFLLVMISGNSYALKKNKLNELLLGSLYGAFAIFSLLAQDFISMFVGIEMMMIASSIIIFIGGHEQSINAAKKYFLTHFISSNMILIGIVHIMSVSNSSEIILVTNLMDNPQYSQTILYIMFAGMVINIAAFPFSGWMVNYYKEASSAGFLYLISFTTKVSIILLIKIFAGFECLKYIAALMILYAGFKAIFEDHILSSLCYLSIISMGVMVLGISSGNDIAINAVVYYLFIHIIYKFLLSLSIVQCFNASNDHKFLRLSNNKILNIAIILGIALMINFPLSLGFYSKLDISHFFSGSLFYYLILLANLLTIVALPWKDYLKSTKILDIKVDIYGIIPTIIIAGLFGFGIYKPVYNFDEYGLIKQVGIFVISAIIIMCLNQTRKIGNSLNLIDFIGNILTYIYNKYWQNNDSKKSKNEAWNFDSLEEQIMRKISIFHNQQTAIFAVFLLFIVMLIVLTRAS